MSNPSLMSRSALSFPTLPKGEVLGTYSSYDEALKVVDHLAKVEFEVKQVSIVGSDLRTVERVTGKMSYGKAALAGAASGVWMGLFFGLLMFLFIPSENALLYVGAAILIGAGFGMLFGVVSYAFTRRRRDFTSVHQVIAAKYEVIVDAESLAAAQRALQKSIPE
ncbi:MAG TPA: hypothetical protein PK781_08885 [Terrimesophilobacter sp.]|nr:hypothetical protein [Terrimesophilobacter sp.]HRQ00561.1 hypothetical protein [Terrimesophilobacter sp.]